MIQGAISTDPLENLQILLLQRPLQIIKANVDALHPWVHLH
mgnify:CR=1 FL=1